MIEETVIYKTVDGVELPADVHQDPRRAHVGTLLWIHGGALISGTRKEIPRDVIGWFVERGFTVVLVDYRLAPEVDIVAIHSDIVDAYRWSQCDGPARFNIDPARIVLVGQSAGGYLALALATTLRPRAVVSLYGYGRINGAWSNALPNSVRQIPRILFWREVLRSRLVPSSWRPRARVIYGGLVRYSGIWTRSILGNVCRHDDDDAMRRFNPLETATPEFPPTIFIHGDADSDVPVEESRLMAGVLERLGVAHELVIHPGVEHGFDIAGISRPVVVDSLTRIVAFLTKHLDGAGNHIDRAEF